MDIFSVLIVDDQEITHRQLKRLKLWGEPSGFMICFEADNGRDALFILENNTVDLVITDIRMPIIDGIELLGQISERKLCPCVVLLSDYREFDYARQGLVLGAFDYLNKPVGEEELHALLLRVKGFLNDKKYSFYPDGDIRQIIALIDKGSRDAVDAAAAMTGTTWEALDNDLIRTGVILKRVVAEIAESFLESYPWLRLFVDAYELSNPDLTKCSDLPSMKGALASAVEKLLETVNRFEYDKQEKGVVNRICKYAVLNVDRDISAKTISEALFINKTYLSEVFKTKTGMTLGEYLTMLKMERAKRLLTEGALKNYEIADQLGFKDVEYFGKLFKRYTTQTPSEFRKMCGRKP